MEKRQYHKEMHRIIAEIPAGEAPRLLLHSCCGPCSTAVLEQLTPHFEIVLFYYNPNIAPAEEFARRLETQKQLLAQLTPEHPITLIAPPYDDAPFWEAVKGAEDTPEMGERCEKYSYRLTNYPDCGQTVMVTLYVRGRRVIAGDVHSTALDGFMHGLKTE